MKILKASEYPTSVIDLINCKSIEILSYNALLNMFFEFCYAESNFFKLNIEENKSFKVEEIISNNEKLQTQWAFENQIKFTRNNWFYDILFAQIEKFRPNVFFAHDRKCLNKEFIKKVRNSIPEVELIIGWDGVDLKDGNLYSTADVVLTPVEFITENYKKLGLKSYTLPFAFEKTINKKIKPIQLITDLSFVGSVFIGKGSHNKRREYLMELSRAGFKDFNLSGSCDVFDDILSKKTASLIKNEGLTGLWNAYQIKRISKVSLYGLDMYNKFACSKIVLNTHIDLAGNNAGNIRLFEATGVGSCLLTDYKENLTNYFKIDEEIVVFKNKGELLEKVNFLLKNEKIREKIAKAGQKKTIEHHNYNFRSKNLIEIININT